MSRVLLIPFLLAAASLVHPAAAPAAAPRSLWVDPTHGRDADAGTRARPLRTVSAAWRRVPQDRRLTRAYRIRLRAGRYPASSVPVYWEQRQGSATRQIVLESADGRGRAVLPPLNIFAVSGLTLRGVTVRGGGDVVHCEQCRDLLLDHVTVQGTRAGTQETVKVNQSDGVTIRASTITGAGDNAFDAVAVRRIRLIGNVIGDAEDWCGYAKGGSADVVVRGNLFRNCGTGGFTAGQGSGLQFMQPPFLQYEASGVAVIANTVRDVGGAAFGAQGAFNALFARNVARRVGTRSHLLEVGFGSRSCDGQPGDDARERCGQYLGAGAWGTTVVDDGTNFVRIPNRHVYWIDNVVDEPAGVKAGDQLLSVFGATGEQPGSGVPSSGRADEDLRFVGNVLWSGDRSQALGVGEDANGGCPPDGPTCNATQLRRENVLNARKPELSEAPGGRLVPAGWTARRSHSHWPAPALADRPPGTPVAWRSWPPAGP